MLTARNMYHGVAGFVNNRLEGKNMGENDHGLVRGIEALARRDKKLGIAMIQTGHHLNTCQKCHCFIQLTCYMS
jgi:hypothetical protein